jgi:hypothetical protein
MLVDISTKLEERMNTVRRIGATLAATVAAAGMTSMAVASPASAASQGPRPVSNWLRAVPANTSSWINIYWRTDRPVCDAKIWVDGGRRVDVSYPSNRSYTSFSRGSSLRPGRTDYSAVRVDPNFDRAGVALLRTTITYTNCGWHSRPMRNSSVVTLPVRSNGHDNNNDGHNNNGNNNGHDNNGHDNNGHNNNDSHNNNGSHNNNDSHGGHKN